MLFENRVNGIEAGRLYPYLNTHEVHHCPGDDRMRKRNPPNDAYISFECVGGLNGINQAEWNAGNAVEKLSEIKFQSEKYIFVETDYQFPDGSPAPYNNGAWLLMATLVRAAASSAA